MKTMAKFQVLILIFIGAFLSGLAEGNAALHKSLKRGLIINRRPEVYFDSSVVDQAYSLCSTEIEKDIRTGRVKRSGIPKWYPIAGGRRYFLPHSERQKLSLGENCLLLKGIEIVKNRENLMMKRKHNMAKKA